MKWEDYNNSKHLTTAACAVLKQTLKWSWQKNAVLCLLTSYNKVGFHPLMQFEEPIYGSLNTDFTTFVTPGAVLRSVAGGLFVFPPSNPFPKTIALYLQAAINLPPFFFFMLLSFTCSITFYLAVGLTALSFVLERKEGLLDRCWVAGQKGRNATIASILLCNSIINTLNLQK